MIYCTDCGKVMPCSCREETGTKQENKMVDSKKGTGKASKEVVEK